MRNKMRMKIKLDKIEHLVYIFPYRWCSVIILHEFIQTFSL